VLLSTVWPGLFFLDGRALAANYSASHLQPHQGSYFKWAAPPDWRQSESNAGVTLTSPDGKYSAFLATLFRSRGSRTPLNFLQWVLGRMGCTNVRVLSTKNLPAQRMSYEVWQFVEVTLSYTENGLPVTGVIKSGVANYSGMNDAMIVGYRAAQSDFQNAQSFMPRIAKSIVLTNAAGANGNDTLLRPKNHPLDNTPVIQAGQNRQKGVDEAMRKGANASRGTVDLYDSSTGQTINAWTQNKPYYWHQPGSNAVVGTDTYNPPGVGYVPLTQR
jgi:hypothetical protein